MHHLYVTMPNDVEIVHSRVFDAPIADVFEALTCPELLARWYGPPGWTVLVAEADVRPGGQWRIVTRKPNGREITQHGEFVEVTPPTRFVKTEFWLDWDVGEVRVTSDLVQDAERTTLTVTTRYPSKEVRQRLIESGADRDAAVHYDKLDAFLGRFSPDGTPGSRVGPAL